jgi:DNA-binding response OmpR family regulator
LQGLTVLVVDDHHDTVDMFQQFLSGSGAYVLGAYSAKAALVLAEASVVDAVLVDLRMPQDDGFWLLRQVRASGTQSAAAPVFAISGERHELLDPASGFAGYFFKPVDLDALLAALAVLPRRSQ